jgi:hypothetical protein
VPCVFVSIFSTETEPTALANAAPGIANNTPAIAIVR